MTRPWRPRSVRVRLTLWHLAALVAVLVLYAGGTFVFVRHSLMASLDAQLSEDFERAEDVLRRNPDGTLSYPIADSEPPDPGDPDRRRGPWMVVRAFDGRLLYRDALAPAPTADRAPAPPPDRLSYRSLQSPGGIWLREVTGRGDLEGGPAVVRIARSEELVRQETRDFLAVFLLGLPLACALAGVGAYFLARRALAPIDRMASAARSITAARLAERLPIDNPDDELGQLATVFNATFGRLEASFEQLRRFTADASHELRTPLTAIRAVGEVGLRDRRSGQEYREIIGSMLEEAERLNRLVESLLTLARADSGAARLATEPVDLAVMVRDVADHLSVLAEDKQQTIAIDAPQPAIVQADRLVLRQAIVNVVDNAIKYSPPRGQVRIAVSVRPSDVTVSVEDSGPGIAPEDVERIFERFSRLDRSRSRDAGGTGLGLAIARSAVEAHGGRIEVEAARPAGTVFRIVLPR